MYKKFLSCVCVCINMRSLSEFSADFHPSRRPPKSHPRKFPTPLETSEIVSNDAHIFPSPSPSPNFPECIKTHTAVFQKSANWLVSTSKVLCSSRSSVMIKFQLLAANGSGTWVLSDVIFCRRQPIYFADVTRPVELLQLYRCRSTQHGFKLDFQPVLSPLSAHMWENEMLQITE